MFVEGSCRALGRKASWECWGTNQTKWPCDILKVKKSENQKRYNHQVITSRGGPTKTEAHACTWCRSRWWRSWCVRCREPPGWGSTSANWLDFTEWATRIPDEVVSCPQGKSDPNYFCKMWAVGWELTSANWQGFTGTLWFKEWQCKIDRHQQSPKLWWVSTK